MQLVLLDAPATIAERLRRAGLVATNVGGTPSDHTAVVSFDDRPCSGDERVWLWCDGDAPPARTGDLLLVANRPVDVSNIDTVSLYWEDSPFGVEHGFRLSAGGTRDALHRAKPVLDALAPTPGAWLHAGGLTAPAFLADIMQLVGTNLRAFAPMMMQVPANGMNPIWQLQQTLLPVLAPRAHAYLAASSDEAFSPIYPQQPAGWLMSTPPLASTSPARQLAQMIVWLSSATHGGDIPK